MKHISRSLMSILIIICLVQLSTLFAQTAPYQQINLHFRDSNTGYAVVPQDVLFYDAESGQMVDQVAPSSITPDGAASASLPAGMYLLLTAADGYQPVYVKLFAGDAAVSKYIINLDPLEPPAELQGSFTNPLLRSDVTLISGFVVDDQSGQPLGGVEISSPATSTKTATDSRGYFQFYLPANDITGTFRLEKPGYVSQERINIEIWPEGDWQYRIRLKPGEGSEIINDGKPGQANTSSNNNDEENCEDCGSQKTNSSDEAVSPNPPNSPTNITLTPALLPNTIRVGRNCPGPTSCATVEVYGLQTYCKYVLPAEWFSCWGSLSNGMNSLAAGSVAIRSYAVWHVYHPLTSSYDICDNTFCQFLGNAQSSNGNIAVDATARYVLVTSGNAITRSEYSAENNNSGCGDGYSGTGTSWPCIYDPVCSGFPSNGHGRGLCQWGSARWANGTRILTSAPCAAGVPHGFGTKTWPEILAHYYPDYQLVEGAAASLLSIAPVPATVSPGQTFNINYSLQAAPAMSLMLGASVRPSAGGAWIDDPANDRKLSVNAGVNNVFRPFTLPGNATLGSYDILAALWYDVDENNQINAGDFVLDTKNYNQVLTVGPTAIEPLSNIPPAEFALAQNYPNPFNPRTAIKFSLPQSGQVVLRIYDTLGKELATLINRTLAAGHYKAEWDAENFPAGVYFYRLSVTGENGGETSYIETKKMVLAK